LIHALEVANASQKSALHSLLKGNAPDKVEQVLKIFKDCKVDQWANELKDKYYTMAMEHLDEIAVLNLRKTELVLLAKYLLQRDS
jgi:geranylgeranyl diphosphate synthase type II